MGILDEAIREHLELKRAHGAGDDELKQLEDEAFGQAERPGDEAAPDPFAEAPTEFLTQPGAGESGEEPAARREPTIADLQEPPPPPDLATEAVESSPAEEAPAEEQPAMEHEIVAEPPAPAEAEAEKEIEPSGPSTEERHAISEQPTELFDVEEELGPPSPTDEQIVEEEIAEPRLAPTDPLAGLEEGEEAEVTIEGPAPDDDEEYDDEDDAFWNEQRLSDELDQALEAPPRETETEIEVEVPEDEEEIEVELADDEPESDEYEEPEPAEEPEEPRAESADEDVLEETPDFLEESPEDDQLWFEQKPPKDFDFDD